MKGAKCEEPHIWLSHAGPPPLLALLAGVRGAAGGTEDVQLVCRGGARLPAHRALLAAASPMLRRVLQEHGPDEGPLVVVVEEEQEEVENLLDLLYTGTGAQRDGLKGVLCTLQVNPIDFWDDPGGHTNSMQQLAKSHLTNSDLKEKLFNKKEPEEIVFVKEEVEMDEVEMDEVDDDFGDEAFQDLPKSDFDSDKEDEEEWTVVKKKPKKKIKHSKEESSLREKSKTRNLTIAQKLATVIELETSGLPLETFAETNSFFIASLRKWVEEKEAMKARVEAGLGDMNYVTKKSPKPITPTKKRSQPITKVDKDIKMEDAMQTGEVMPKTKKLKGEKAIDDDECEEETIFITSDIEALLDELHKDATLSFNQILLNLDSQLGRKFKGKKICRTCDTVFSSREKYISHMASHLRGPKTLACRTCDYTATDIQCLKKHITLYHAAMHGMLCPDCGDHFENVLDYKAHRRVKHKKKKYQPRKVKSNIDDEHTRTFVCDFCAKGFKSKSNLTCHINLVHGNPHLWTCEQCGHTYKTLSKYNAHIALHNPPDVPCPHCGRKFHNGPNLDRHIKNIHTSEKDMDYHCTQCGKGFMSSASFEGHMNMHLGLKPYKCRYCNNCYQNNSNCYAHEKKSHPDVFVRQTQRNGGCRVVDRVNLKNLSM